MKVHATLMHGRHPEIAVAAPSRKAAVELLSAIVGRLTVNDLARYGYRWSRGQVAGTDVIFENPGVVFMRRRHFGPDPWVRFEAETARAWRRRL